MNHKMKLFENRKTLFFEIAGFCIFQHQGGLISWFKLGFIVSGPIISSSAPNFSFYKTNLQAESVLQAL